MSMDELQIGVGTPEVWPPQNGDNKGDPNYA